MKQGSKSLPTCLILIFPPPDEKGIVLDGQIINFLIMSRVHCLVLVPVRRGPSFHIHIHAEWEWRAGLFNFFLLCHVRCTCIPIEYCIMDMGHGRYLDWIGLDLWPLRECTYKYTWYEWRRLMRRQTESPWEVVGICSKYRTSCLYY
jgi:hypothetical protein